MNICITGVSGMLGSEIARLLKTRFNILGLYNTRNPKIEGIELKQVNLIDFKNVNEILNEFTPDIVIHCAAITNVDLCEDDNDKAIEVNVETVDNLVTICNKLNTKIIYVSTDSVFNGETGNYSENDNREPINFYAKTKFLAENIIMTNAEQFLIFRTNLIGYFKDAKKSLVNWILKTVNEKDEINLFNDVVFNPLNVETISDIIVESIEKNLNGVYHIGSKESLSKLDFGKKILNAFSIKDIKINSISVDDINFKASRPKNTSLNCSKIEKEGILMPSIINEIEKLVRRKNEF